jgi:hypothetical protein
MSRRRIAMLARPDHKVGAACTASLRSQCRTSASREKNHALKTTRQQIADKKEQLIHHAEHGGRQRRRRRRQQQLENLVA